MKTLMHASLGLVLSSVAALRPAHADDPRPNVLFILIDDLGTDRLGLTSEYPSGPFAPPYAPPPTPNIDALAAGGVLFTNAYASPVCSPARALLMTGRYGFRTGIGRVIHMDDDETGGLRTGEYLIPEMLKRVGYSTAVFGKWHLGDACHLGAPQDNQNQGVDRFIGSKANFDVREDPPEHYFHWPRIDHPGPVQSPGPDCFHGHGNRHSTEEIVDEALNWIGGRSGPWFCHVAFHAVHVPLQQPDMPFYYPAAPEGLSTLDAMIEHTDANIGRLLLGVNPDTTMVVLMSDNGTQSGGTGPNQNMFPPYDPTHGKGTVYEHGVRVPLIIRGPLVVGPVPRESNVLVSLVDVYRTLAELLDIDIDSPPFPPRTAEDSVSFAGVVSNTFTGARDTVFCEQFPNHPPASGASSYDRSLRNATHKLIRRFDGFGVPPGTFQHELYDLSLDPFEQTELIELHGGVANLPAPDRAEYDALSKGLDAIPTP